MIAIRSETEADATAIAEVTVAAFKTLAVSNHTEQFIIAALRAAKALTLSLVAEADRRVVGHIAFSPVAISDGTRNWYGLGPVSVLPAYQRQGIGKALIQEGLSRLRSMGAQGCCLVGHPDYYRKFGFRNILGLVLEGVAPEFFFALPFGGQAPQGSVSFHDAFKANGRIFRLPGALKRDPAVDAWMGRHAGELGAIAQHWFNVIRGCGDDVRELLHDGHPTACVADAAFAYVNAFKVHVNVGFFSGAQLPDPAGLLEGSGKYMRHVKLRPGVGVDAAALTRLIESAYADMKNR